MATVNEQNKLQITSSFKWVLSRLHRSKCRRDNPPCTVQPLTPALIWSYHNEQVSCRPISRRFRHCQSLKNWHPLIFDFTNTTCLKIWCRKFIMKGLLELPWFVGVMDVEIYGIFHYSWCISWCWHIVNVAFDQGRPQQLLLGSAKRCPQDTGRG